MISSYNIKFTSQKVEFIENTLMIKMKNSRNFFPKNSRNFFPKNSQQISIQKIILQTQTEMSNIIITFIITDFSNSIVLNLIDVLQKKINEIAKRRIAFLQKTLRKKKSTKKSNSAFSSNSMEFLFVNSF